MEETEDELIPTPDCRDSLSVMGKIDVASLQQKVSLYAK
jgi:hypothetical protein